MDGVRVFGKGGAVMLRKTRISISRLMGVVLVAAIGFAALRNSSEAWAGAMLLLTCGVLMLAVVGALSRGPGERAWWLGFALFGGGYLALAHATASSPSTLPTITLAETVGSGLGVPLDLSIRGRSVGWSSLSPTYRILHCLWALGLAVLGCILAGVVVTNSAVVGQGRVVEARSDRPTSWSRWKRPALIGLSGFWMLAMAAAVGRWPVPGIWAGVSFLVTCGLLGMAALGAVFSRGRGREAWLGAVVFGFGYLALSFGKSELFIVAPHLPTEGMLNSVLRSGIAPVQSAFPDFTTPGFDRVRNEVIRRKLDQPIRFHFPEETSLDELLKYIRDATRDTNFPGIPIYVDPIGLQTAERSLNSTVQIDIDAIPTREALRLCLKQLGLAYSVRDGFLMITDEDSATIPVYEDPVQVVGHSLLALIAAGLGAVAAPLVSDRMRRPRGRDHSSA
jgi:hypothetical protein